MNLEFIKKDREYSLFELFQMIKQLENSCKLIAKDDTNPVEMRIVAQQVVDYSENMTGAMMYLRPTQLKQWCGRLQSYAEQLVAMINDRS